MRNRKERGEVRNPQHGKLEPVVSGDLPGGILDGDEKPLARQGFDQDEGPPGRTTSPEGTAPGSVSVATPAGRLASPRRSGRTGALGRATVRSSVPV